MVQSEGNMQPNDGTPANEGHISTTHGSATCVTCDKK